MSQVLEFRPLRNPELLPLQEAVDVALRQLGIPARFREKAAAWANQEMARYHVPDFALSMTLPAGLTDAQADHIEREVHRELKRCYDALLSAKRDYILDGVKHQLTEFLRNPK